MRARRGFALMASLWLMVAIAALSLEISHSARTHRLAAANALEEQRSRAAALSGVDHARARLARQITEGGTGRSWRDPRHLVDPWFSFDTLLQSELDGARYDVRLFDLGSRLNVNLATDADWRRYFGALRVDAYRAEALVQHIADWKDADDERRTQGGEAAEYLRSGARDLPRNAPFDRIEELASIRGMTPEILRRMRPDLTTLGDGRVNVNSASRAVLMSLPGFSEATAEALVRQRAMGARIAGWTDLLQIIPKAARAPLEVESAQLFVRLVYDTRNVGVESTGNVVGSPVRVVIDAMLVRAGNTVFNTWSGTR